MRKRGRPIQHPTEGLQPLPAPAETSTASPEPPSVDDYTGRDWRELPYGAVKAARNGSVGGFTVVGKNKCVQCWREMWTCDIERENLCEEDDYYLRTRNWDLKASRAKRNNQKVLNPFGEPDNRTMVVNPFKDLE